LLSLSEMQQDRERKVIQQLQSELLRVNQLKALAL
jgi:hypothetical protein